MRPWKVAEILGLKVTEDERGRKQVPKAARDAWNQYWKTYAGERKVIDECSEKVVRGEPIVSPWGRRRLFPTQFAEKWQLAAAQRQAYSTLIQGTGADCCHYAFYTVAETLKRERWGRALFEVHDQIVCSVKKEYLQQATKFIEEAMIGAGKVIGLTVPLSVESEEPKERWTK